uniref:Uncharacterized protein n=2 Tax=Rhodnius prolixus TaxID=13249 RepID=T1HAC4_RHOPR
MDEVRMMQNRVIEAQDRFIAAQDRRREVGKELAGIQSKLKELHSELDTTSRGEERYLQLITEEHSVLKNERKLMADFVQLEREERDSFNMLSSYVKESHEKERAQADRTKYWSIIASIFGTFIGIAGTSINNEFKMRELRKLVKESAVTSPDTSTVLAQIVNNMKIIVDQLTNRIIPTEEKPGKFDELKSILEKTLKSLQNIHGIASLPSQVEEMKGMLKSSQRSRGQMVTIPQDVESMIVQYHREVRYIVIAVTVMGIIVPVIVTFLSR